MHSPSAPAGERRGVIGRSSQVNCPKGRAAGSTLFHVIPRYLLPSRINSGPGLPAPYACLISRCRAIQLRVYRATRLHDYRAIRLRTGLAAIHPARQTGRPRKAPRGKAACYYSYSRCSHVNRASALQTYRATLPSSCASAQVAAGSSTASAATSHIWSSDSSVALSD